MKIIYCPYKGSTPDIRSNIPLCLQEFPRASPPGAPSGKGVYLTVYPSSRPNMDTIFHESKVTLFKDVIIFFNFGELLLKNGFG